MSITGSLVTHVCIWWIVFFSILPVGIKSEKLQYKESIRGNDPGAPKNPKIFSKFIFSTLITSIIFLGIYCMVKYNYFNLREYLQ